MGFVLRCIWMIAILLAPALQGQEVSTREMRLVYVSQLEGLPEDADEIRVWVPLPSSNRHQSIDNIQIEPAWAWKHHVDPVYGTAYLYAVLDEVPRKAVEIRITFDVDRRIVLFDRLQAQQVSQEERRRNLMPDRLVTISPRVNTLASRITANARGTAGEARAIYDYVLRNMTYDKSKPGWGRGDTERACEIRAGNCTDFHSLFISLARSRAIPARFLMGVSIPNEASGTIRGYHCWAEFYLDGKGWVPVDISEAWKSDDPAVQNFLFGNLDFDRLELTVGRDIVLHGQSGPPLNYFIHPYVEVDGEPWLEASMVMEFRNRPPARSKK
jgi:transglutaminase-like putative cysteine protease